MRTKRMEFAGADLNVLRLRLAGLGAELDGRWAEKLDAQLHLDHDTSESAYWHAGYHQALADVLSLIAQRATFDSADKSNLRLAVG